MSYLLESLTRKEDVDKLILNIIDKVLVLRIGRASDAVCMQLDEILAKSVRDVNKFVSLGLIDADAPEIQSYIKYFDISLIPATIFFFNAHHMKMDSGTPDHTKWIGAFHSKQDFIDVVEEYQGSDDQHAILSWSNVRTRLPCLPAISMVLVYELPHKPFGEVYHFLRRCVSYTMCCWPNSSILSWNTNRRARVTKHGRSQR